MQEQVITCEWGGETHEHVYPADWIFGGADGLHPGADRRWKPTTYTYRNEMLEQVYVTQTPLCDEQALEEFTKVRDIGSGFDPVYLEILPPGGVAYLASWRYNGHSDTLSPIKKGVQDAAQESSPVDPR